VAQGMDQITDGKTGTTGKKNTGVAVSGTRPCVLREYVYVNG
jgi:hypothetical protein